jgi:hypothetical protein
METLEQFLIRQRFSNDEIDGLHKIADELVHWVTDRLSLLGNGNNDALLVIGQRLSVETSRPSDFARPNRSKNHVNEPA